MATRTAVVLLQLVLLALAMAAVFVHWPGHVSTDSSEQLYEALTGRSISWSPPLMSALLRWMGGGERATGHFVLLSSALTYAGLAMAVAAATWRPLQVRLDGGGLAGLLVALVLVLNPLVFLYVGIVWKDVLFAALVCAACGCLLLVASLRSGRARTAGLWIAIALLAPAFWIRQQGLVLVPPLALAALVALAGPRQGLVDRRWWPRFLGAACVALVLFGAVQWLARWEIRGSGAKSTSVGLVGIARYDLAGMVAAGADQGIALPGALESPGFREAARRSYSPDRIDIPFNDPELVRAFESVDDARLVEALATLVTAHPATYVQLKLRRFGWMLGGYRLDRCLPIHVGVAADPDRLRAVGLEPGVDRYDQRIFGASLELRSLMFYRHWFYLALLAVCAACVFIRWRRQPGMERNVLWAMLAGLALFYLSFLVAGMACDFRYLYPGLLATVLLALFLVCRLLLAGGLRSDRVAA